jgi:signal transduction histidine kinase
MTGWFLGKRAAVGISVVAFVSIAILGLLEISGAYTFPIAVRSPQVWWTSLSIVCIFTGVVVWHLVGNYEFVQGEEVSLRRKLDAALAEREQQLEAKTHELHYTSATLGNVQTEFEKAYPLAMLAAVVPAVAHDLATPVGNAHLAANTLTNQIADFKRKLESGNLRRSDLEQHLRTMTEGVQIISSATDRTSQLVTSLKHMSIDQATQQRRHFDLATLLEEIGVTMAPTLKKSHFALATEFEAGLSMDSYPGPLGQVVSNLIQNCAVHGFYGKPSGAIWLRAMRLGQENVQIEVEDDGLGMTEEVKLRAFESFFTTKAGKGGSGVGLTLSQRLVEQTLGGSISVSSTLGVGTRFTVQIPLAAPNSASAH